MRATAVDAAIGAGILRETILLADGDTARGHDARAARTDAAEGAAVSALALAARESKDISISTAWADHGHATTGTVLKASADACGPLSVGRSCHLV